MDKWIDRAFILLAVTLFVVSIVASLGTFDVTHIPCKEGYFWSKLEVACIHGYRP